MVNKEIVHNVAINIADKYDILLFTFNDITACAKGFFENRQFFELFSKQQERYRLYGKFVKEVYADTLLFLGDNIHQEEYWKAIKIEFSKIIKTKPHKLNSETFYNSITRKVFFDKSSFNLETVIFNE